MCIVPLSVFCLNNHYTQLKAMSVMWFMKFMYVFPNPVLLYIIPLHLILLSKIWTTEYDPSHLLCLACSVFKIPREQKQILKYYVHIAGGHQIIYCNSSWYKLYLWEIFT